MIQYQFQLQSTNFFQQISDNPESRYSTNNVISSNPIILTKAKLSYLNFQTNFKMLQNFATFQNAV